MPGEEGEKGPNTFMQSALCFSEGSVSLLCHSALQALQKQDKTHWLRTRAKGSRHRLMPCQGDSQSVGDLGSDSRSTDSHKAGGKTGVANLEPT